MSKTQKKPVATKSTEAKKPAVKITEANEVKKSTKNAKLTKAKVNKIIASVEKVGRRSTKQNALISLLERPAGATVDEMAKATGWQSHSVLGAISGVLRKRLKLTVASTKEERGRVYRIAGGR